MTKLCSTWWRGLAYMVYQITEYQKGGTGTHPKTIQKIKSGRKTYDALSA